MNTRELLLPTRSGRPLSVTGFDPALCLLLAGNLLPLYGALFGGWSVLSILQVYWAENVIIGVLTLLEMLTVALAGGSVWGAVGSLFPMAFFCFHYGMFTFVHGVFIYAIFGAGPFAHGVLHWADLEQLYDPFLPGHPLFYAAVTILLAHLNSLRANFIGAGEYRALGIPQLMFRPYGRVMLLHVVLLLGGLLAQQTGSNIAALALLVAIKTTADLILYRKYHTRPAAGAAA
ncbi:MAG: hypothetical protein JSR36_01830 [Proteobacteria bacterium]|nr:hypothetical protein [Pseudomonadota bacterium]